MAGEDPASDGEADDQEEPADADDGDDLPESDEFPTPEPGRSVVPGDAVRPLANAVVFVVAWSALLVYVGRDPLQAVAMGVAGGAIYFVAAYYVLS